MSQEVVLGERTWTDVRDAPSFAVLVPIGSCEQHGPHLPLDTDTRIAVAIATRAASRCANAVVAPAIGVAASGEHAGFPGTLSIGNEVLALVIVELVRSADWAGRVVLVNGHGGNTEAVRDAIATLRADGRSVTAWSPSAAAAGVRHADAHAGRFETSLLLAIAPDVVRVDQAEAGDTRALAELLPALRSAGVGAVSPNGVLGDPTGASAEEGARLLDALTADLVALVGRR
jgi:mycofactocin precursor peptide peptidase